jgi:hypothetical protein
MLSYLRNHFQTKFVVEKCDMAFVRRSVRHKMFHEKLYFLFQRDPVEKKILFCKFEIII